MPSDTKNVVATNVLEIAWRLDPRTGPAHRHERLGYISRVAAARRVQT